MREWAKDQTILDIYIVTIGLDTNILSFLVDKSYVTLDKVYDVIKNCPFTSQVSSRFVLYEYIGIRKREHFLRKALEASNPSGTINNISSILRYKDDWKTSDLKYFDVLEETIVKINHEKEIIETDLEVKFDNSRFHDNLFDPACNLHLNSRISKEDSLVTISALSPDDSIKIDSLCLLTGDGPFVNSWKDKDYEEKVKSVFVAYNLSIPEIINVRDIHGINTMDSNKVAPTDDEIIDKTNQLIKNIILSKNKDIFLGKTFDTNCSKNPQIICFELQNSITLPEKPYLTIIGKNLDFVLYSSTPVDTYKNKEGVTLASPLVLLDTQTENKFSFKWPDLPNILGMTEHTREIYEAIHEEGNLIFLHPSTFE